MQIAKGITTKMSIEPLFFVKSRATRNKQFDESDFQQEILEARKTFKLNSCFLVDMSITSFKDRFKELMVSKDIFRFLLSSGTLKSLNDNEP